jgi:FtsH-binding integral membrane protein
MSSNSVPLRAPLTRDAAGTLLGQTMGLVAASAFDFQSRRHSQDLRTAPLLAASIFLDILNVFLLLLSLCGGSRD